MSFTTNAAPLYSIRYLHFIDLVRITSIALKSIESKAPFIEWVAFAIWMHHNLSPLFTNTGCSSMLDCIVCSSCIEQFALECAVTLMAYYDKFPLVNTESPCVSSVQWKNMPSRIPQYENPLRFHQRYPGKTLKCTLYTLYFLGLSHFLSQIIHYPTYIWKKIKLDSSQINMPGCRKAHFIWSFWL